MNNYWKTKKSAHIFKLAAEAALGNRGKLRLCMRKLNNNFRKSTNFWNLLECRSLILLAYYNSWTTVFLSCDDVDLSINAEGIFIIMGCQLQALLARRLAADVSLKIFILIHSLFLYFSKSLL